MPVQCFVTRRLAYRVCCAVGALALSVRFAAAETAPMVAHFIDVGQADATLLEFPCGAVLIDAGARDQEKADALVAYLQAFFDDPLHTALHHTLDAIIITHNHIDHTRALREIVESFTVERFIDSGQSTGTGTGEPNWVRNNAETLHIETRQVADSEITRLPTRTGLTDDIIDPIDCGDVNPRIRILSGRMDDNPGWPQGEWANKNNHSLVTRVDYGESSFLFTGDLEEYAIGTLLDWYRGTTTLDVDVYHVGHHGSYNGTTRKLLEAMTPAIAVISMEDAEYGRSHPQEKFTGWQFGHPRRVTVDLLTQSIATERATKKTVLVANGVRDFSPVQVEKAILATGWDGTVRIQATTDGRYDAVIER